MVIHEPNGKKWILTIHVDEDSYMVGFDGVASPWLEEFLVQLEQDLKREQEALANAKKVV